MPNEIRRPHRGRSLLTVVHLFALLLMVSTSSCSKSLSFTAGDKPLKYWTIVLDNDRFLAYRSTVYSPASPLEHPPPPECNWQAIETLRPFARDNLWLPGLVYVIPVNSNEPYLDSVQKLFREETKVSWANYVPLSELPPSQELQTFRNHLDAKSP